MGSRALREVAWLARARGRRWADGLPAGGAAFFVEQDQAVVHVEVGQLECEGAAAAGGGFGVQSQ